MEEESWRNQGEGIMEELSGRLLGASGEHLGGIEASTERDLRAWGGLGGL